MVAQKSAALRLLLACCRLTKGLAASAGRIEDADGRGSERYGERATQKQSREKEAEG